MYKRTYYCDRCRKEIKPKHLLSEGSIYRHFKFQGELCSICYYEFKEWFEKESKDE